MEVVLRNHGELPAVVSVRYGTGPGQSDRLLLVPVTTAHVGPPSAEVRLAAFDPAQPWRAHIPVPPAEVTDWSEETIGASIAAAATRATLQAWRDVLPLVAEPVRRHISERLR
jgi:hypothetical protein